MTCGYCYEENCICDGFGNDPKTGLPVDFSKGGPDTQEATWPPEETALTWADGTPYEPEPHSRHPRTDNRSFERSWRPQHPH